MNIQTGMYIENRYEILGKIGAGGMSDVFKARDHKLNRFVAIKFLKPEFCEDKNFVKNFQIEAQSAAALLHPNVVSVYDVNQTDGIYYIVMEYVDGITLKKYIERNGRLPVKEATSIAIQVAQGIDAAHNANIIHRDIKPQNVLISREGKIKVTDFGIARTTTANTISTDILGSVQYISPEQARGGQVDTRTDIYSFGIVYYEMITGRLPFDGDSTVAIALKHIQENVPRAGDVVDGVPSSVSRIIEKCTQRKPDRRYQKTSSLLADLKTSLITPNEDFVVLEPEPSESATIIMSGEDAEILRREGSKALMSGQRPSSKASADRNYRKYPTYQRRYNEYDRRDHQGYDSSPNPRGVSVQHGNRKNTARNTGKKKSDRILMACGIAAIIVIIALLAVVCVKTFSQGGCAGNTTTRNGVQTHTEPVTLTSAEVPSVVGMEADKAQNELENLGFVVKVVYSHSDSVAKEHVIDQSVSNGVSYETGQEIMLTVSSGQEQVKIPDYSGMDAEVAQEALNKLGFRTITREEYSDNVDEDKVIKTSPAGGTMVDPDAQITVVVSMGPENKLVSVPDVIWYSVNGAIELLNENLLQSYTTYQESEEMAGYVMYQEPAAGEEVPEWTWVRLVVGTEPETEEYYEWDEGDQDYTDWSDQEYDDSGNDDQGYDDQGYDDSGNEDPGYDDSGNEDPGYDDSGNDNPDEPDPSEDPGNTDPLPEPVTEPPADAGPDIPPIGPGGIEISDTDY